MTFDYAEVRLLRGALVTIEHYMNSVWDEAEVSAVSGYPMASFVSTRQQIDSLKTAEDRRADQVRGVRVALGQLEMFDDDELQGRRLRTLRAVIDEAQGHGIPVTERLRRLAQTR
jgi:hypothetical protein